jgi:hypothetical protein
LSTPPPTKKPKDKFFSDDLWAMERDNVVIDYEKKLGAGAFCNVYQGNSMLFKKSEITYNSFLRNA